MGRGFLLGASAIAFAVGLPIEGYNQASAQIDEIIVTSRKRAESVLDVPLSVTALSSGTIESAGITNLEDIGLFIPNVNLNVRSDNEPNVVIRGVGAFGNTQGVGFYIDDVQNFTDQSTRLAELERIEVIKGPQGTLYGGSNVGGAVKFVLKEPGEEFSGYFVGEGGSRDTGAVLGAADIPLVEGKLYSRLSFFAEHTDGFIDNNFLDTNVDHSDEVGVRLALRAHPTDNLRIDLSSRFIYLDDGGFFQFVRHDAFDEIPRDNQLSEDVFFERLIVGNILKFNYDASFGTFTSISSHTYRHSDFLFDIDEDSIRLFAFSAGDRDETDVYTQELRFTSNEDGPLKYVAGLYFVRIEDQPLFLNVDIDLNADMLPIPVPTIFVKDFGKTTLVETQYAAFFNGSYTHNNWELGFGARVNHAVSDGKSFGSPATGALPFDTLLKDTVFLPKATLSYSFENDLLGYFAYARGFEPGGLNLTSEDRPVFKPEFANSFELGLKGPLLDQRLIFNVAAFYIKYRDRQFESRIFLPDGRVIEAVDNIGESTNFGFEADATFQANDNWLFGGSVGYLHSEWDSAVFDGMRFDGNTPPDSPEVTATAYVDTNFPVFEGNYTVSTRIDATYRGSSFWDIANRAQQDAYQIVNGRLAFGDTDGNWEISVRASNILDQEYITEGAFDFEDTGAVDALGRCDRCHLSVPGEPRTIIGSLRVNF